MELNDSGIRIHPPGTRITDYDAVSRLTEIAPTALAQAQRVMIAAENYNKKWSFFGTKTARIQRLHAEIYVLREALENDQIIYRDLGNDDIVAELFSFLSLFSDIFPNWQEEYAILNRIIPRCF